MKTPVSPVAKKILRPYTRPDLTKQLSLKDITLFTDIIGPEGEQGGRGGGADYDDRV